MNFEEANKKCHPVNTQWHYPILIEHGYVALTQEAVGLVRTYVYEHPTTKHQISCTTGAHADYWTDKQNGAQGYWADLAPHLDRITN